MANVKYRGPRVLAEILGDLFSVRGYGRLRALSELEEVWNAAVGEPYCGQTRIGEVRRGVLYITVAHSTLLEELTAFRKPVLLQALRTSALGITIHDIRFRIGPIKEPEPTKVDSSSLGNSASGLPRRSKTTPETPANEQRRQSQSTDHDRTGGED